MVKTVKEGTEKRCEYDLICEAERFIRSVTDLVPKVGVICGSGLGGLSNVIESPTAIPYAKIPHFPRSTVVGHSGELVFGYHSGVPVVCMRGRVHLYEGYKPQEIVRPVRLMVQLGIEVLIVTNASGSVSEKFKPGDFMVIRDHISIPGLAGNNPLTGPHDSRFGERFVTMSNAYDTDLMNDLEDVAHKLNILIEKGIYMQVSGPTYETPAEARFLKLVGADTVGMSTVPEVVVAHQMGVRCLGISLITNDILTNYDSTEDMVNHEEVVEMGDKKSKDFIQLVTTFIESLKNKYVKVPEIIA